MFLVSVCLYEHIPVFVCVCVCMCVCVCDLSVYCSFFLGRLFGGPILFLLSSEVSGTSGTMSILYIYVNNMADF